MESRQASGNRMAIRGLLLVLVLVIAGAFVLVNLDDDSSSEDETATAEPTATATAEPSETETAVPSPDETSSPDEGDGDATPADPEPTAPADGGTTVPEEELDCPDPAEIGVLVANGTDISGAAGRLTTILEAGNYTTFNPINANPQSASAVYYRANHNTSALCVVEFLGAGSLPVFPMSDPPPGGITIQTLGNAALLILIGPDAVTQSG